MNELPESILKKYPQLKESSLAIKEYKKTGKQTVKCSNCNSIIELREDRKAGILETNCVCGRSKTRSRWDPNKV